MTVLPSETEIDPAKLLVGHICDFRSQPMPQGLPDNAQRALRQGLVLGSGLAFMVLGSLPPATGMMSVCGQIGVNSLLRLFALRWRLLSPWWIVADWSIMVIAMMLPLATLPAAHIRRSGSSPDPLAMAAFIACYLACWILSGVLFIPVGLAVDVMISQQARLSATLAVALIWSCCPVAQRMRNLCHQPVRFDTAGRRSLLAGGAHGARIAVHCIMLCWPWMLVPMIAGHWHIPVMLVVTLLLFSDRSAPPATAVWRLAPAPASAFRAIGSLRA